MLQVAVIGAGVAGITTAKCCLEQSLAVTVFEQSNHIGGLWRWRPEYQEGMGSVMWSTIVNSSKEMSSFSDFPIPDQFPNFMNNRLMYRYILDYAESFNFHSLVRFGHRVLSIERIGHDKTTFKGYELQVEDLVEGKIKRFLFDAIGICTGHNHTPKRINFDGLDRFKGKKMHTHAFKGTDNEAYRDKVVLVIGVGNSAGDVAAELAPIAQQVYISSRRQGTWLIRRTGLNGYPIDTIIQRRAMERTLSLLPYAVRCSLVEGYIKRCVGHKLIGLKPKSTRYFSQHVMVNDLLPTAIHLGQVKIRGAIDHFTEHGVVFADGKTNEETPIDVIIFGTGYRLNFPFLNKSLVNWSESGRIDLFKHVFDPSQPLPERLAFIGLTQPVGSLPPIAEIQARWLSLLLVDRCPRLPSSTVMKNEIDHRRISIRKRYGQVNIDRYTFQADWLDYMDSVAKSAGLKPNIWRYALSDTPLWWFLLTKPAISAQYRLQGEGAKPKLARRLIMEVMKRIKAPYK